jgi:acyl-CoA hydrolase
MVPLRDAACAVLLVVGVGGCGAEVIPHLDSPGTTIVCLGDSITAGVGAGSEPGYPERLALRLGVPVINEGVPGDTSRDALERLGQVLDHDPWLVIIEVGGNDLLQRWPPERTEEALRRMVERLLAARVVPLLVSVDGGLLGDLDPVFERVAEDYGVPLMAGVIDRILSDRRLKSDPIHPNGAGYGALAEAVARRVEPWLEARGGR